MWRNFKAYDDGILPKGPYTQCLRMVDRVLLAGYLELGETDQGLYALNRCCLICIIIPIINLRQSDGCLMVIVGIPILITWWNLVNRGPESNQSKPWQCEDHMPHSLDKIHVQAFTKFFSCLRVTQNVNASLCLFSCSSVCDRLSWFSWYWYTYVLVHLANSTSYAIDLLLKYFRLCTKRAKLWSFDFQHEHKCILHTW